MKRYRVEFELDDVDVMGIVYRYALLDKQIFGGDMPKITSKYIRECINNELYGNGKSCMDDHAFSFEYASDIDLAREVRLAVNKYLKI